jgi:uncharacterized protein YbaP (TraB family)
MTFILLVFPFLLMAGESSVQGPFFSVRSGDALLYLMGTIHVGSEDMLPLDSEIEGALLASELLAVELKMQDKDVAAKATLLTLEYGMYEKADGLKKALDFKTYNRVKKLCKQMGLEIKMVGQMKPWLLATLIELTRFGQSGYSGEYGIDAWLVDRAGEAALPVENIEEVEAHMQALGQLSPESQVFMLQQSLDVTDEESLETIRGMVEGWKMGDLDVLDILINDSLGEEGSEEIYERLFTERNALMLESILAYLESGQTAFVAVGAGHLAGAEGLVQSLIDMGYEVTQH